MLPRQENPGLPQVPARELVASYHDRTKHRTTGFAPGPGSLDWDAQPAPHRAFSGAPRRALPLLTELPLDSRTRAAFAAGNGAQPLLHAATLDWESLGAVLHTALGLTARKAAGPDRWAVRANPSSGNLHPVEVYLLAHGLDWLADGVHHYNAEHHALEHRVRWDGSKPAAGRLWIAITTIMWREAWKYGERAFRYCQLDVGHALGALTVSLAALGLRPCPVAGVTSRELAAGLGLDPAARDTEREEPELLYEVRGAADGPPERPALLNAAGSAILGQPSTIDAYPLYTWPAIDQVARATEAEASVGVEPDSGRMSIAPRWRAARGIGEITLGRRSAMRFDARRSLALDTLQSILEAATDRSCAPLSAARGDEAQFDLALFVHRVDGLPPGTYLYHRKTSDCAALLMERFETTRVPLESSESSGYQLRMLALATRTFVAEVKRAHCSQALAADGCLALGMVTDLDSQLRVQPPRYRELHREAGLIGHGLYLAAEAHGLRGTGIGCFLDDDVQDLLGLSDSRFRSLYHFTLGHALEDPRIQSSPPYPDRTRP